MKKSYIWLGIIILILASLASFRFYKLHSVAQSIHFQTIKLAKNGPIRTKSGITIQANQIGTLKKEELTYQKFKLGITNHSDKKLEIKLDELYLSNQAFATSIPVSYESLQKDDRTIKWGTQIHLKPGQDGQYEMVIPILPSFYQTVTGKLQLYLHYRFLDVAANQIVDYEQALQ
ncbi:hypothetical protein [Listeria valentina]|uniref:hypothetical protein n=1 Tax=Listeria valentina TaxID=2705293 RepID=UPI001431DB57|nr:hypothetical protein [Listeria valentina]